MRIQFDRVEIMRSTTLRLLFIVFASIADLFSVSACAAKKDVLVINDETMPVPVVDVDNPTREPVSLGARLTVPVGGDNSSGDPNTVFFTVPMDRRCPRGPIRSRRNSSWYSPTVIRSGRFRD